MLNERSTSSLICMLALRIKNNLNKGFHESGEDISSEQYAVLKCLWENEGISQRELAVRVNKDKASITRILDIMQKNALLHRVIDQFDRRTYRIFLCDEGKKIENKLRPIAKNAQTELYRTLDSAERHELKRLLLKLISSSEE